MDNTNQAPTPVTTTPLSPKINPLPMFMALTAVFFLTSLVFAFLYFTSSRGIPAPPNNTTSTTPTEPIAQNQSSVPESQVTLTGKITCLQKQTVNGQTTLECALGLQTDDGKYYAISDPDQKFVTTLAGGDTVTITGLLSTPTDSTYNIAGIIEIQSLSK